MIMHLKKDGKVLPQTPIIMDSPMARRATAFYLNYPQILNSHIQNDLKSGNPFEFPGFKTIQDPKDSDAIHEMSGPKVIIAGSGMMVGGRILSHALFYLPLTTTRLLIVGYQGEGTLGRELLERNKKVVIDGQEIFVKAIINDTQAMSSHADESQLINWLRQIKNVKKVFLTHGEDGPRDILSKKISQDLEITDITLPRLNQEVKF